MSEAAILTAEQRADAEDFMAFVHASPSPRHCVAEAIRRLEAAGFASSERGDGAPLGYRSRGGSLVAWRRGTPQSGADSGAGPVRVITGHTDSPNLRIKPRPDGVSAGARQLGVEVYGGALVNSWLDRDLGLCGHVVTRGSSNNDGDGGKNGDGVVEHLVRIDRPVLRVPQLAIHLDREVNTKGLKLNKQTNLKPMWGFDRSGDDADGTDSATTLVDLLAAELGVDAGQILAYQLMAHDVVPPAIGGWYDEWIASPRIDNQLSCWAGIEALLAAEATGTTQIVALFDHEEVGSTSATGADSGLLADLLDELEVRPDARSLCVSADCAHATHPNYADRHDPDHQIAMNAGPVIKINANERYATTPLGHALFAKACEDAGVPHQVFVSRTDMACGSTVGPVTAARTGLETVDVGAPQLAMHSVREMTGSADPAMFKAALRSILA